MKPKSNILLARTGSVRLALALASLLSANAASATNLYWDTNGTTGGSGAATGIWGTNSYWNTDSTGVTNTFTLVTTTADNLYIAAGTNGTTGTITVNGAQAANSITFDDNVATTLTGTSINLGSTTGAGIFVASGDNAANTISTGLVLGAAATIQNAGTGVLTINTDRITGTGNLTLQNNSTTAGGIALSGIMVNNVGSITNSGTSTGGVTISAIIGTNVTGVTQNSSGSTLTLSGTNLFSGDTKSSAGTLIISNNLALQNSALDTSGAGLVKLTVTTPTFGGLKGITDLATVITPANGYSGVTALTLNPGNGVSNTYGGIIANGSGATTLTLTGAYGPGTQVLTGANSYTGLTTISGGTLQIGNGTTGSLNGTTGTALTFNTYGGTFNVMEAASSTQGMGALTFSAGSNTVNSTFNATSATLTFSSLAARAAGSTANFTTTGGANGSTNSIILTGVAAGFIDKGEYFNGADFAAMNATGTYVRALAYGTDTNTVNADDLSAPAGKHVKLTSTPAARTGDTLLSLNLFGSGVGYTMNGGSLTVPGILKSGAGTVGIISGGTSVTTASNAELVIRTDTASDLLKISTPIAGTTGGLTKTGAGTLTLDATNTYTGATTIVAGKLAESTTGLIVDTSALTVNGPTAVFDLGASHNDTVGAVTLSGGGQITGGGTSTLTTGGALTLECGTISSALTWTSGQGAWTKSTNGTVTITGNVGSTTVNNAGALTINAGSVVINGVGAQYYNRNGGANINSGGNVTISGGGAFNIGSASGDLNIGNNTSNASITVTGSGSSLSQGANMRIGTGNSANNNSLTISNGATASFYTFYVAQGNNASPRGNTMTITGAGSSVNVGGVFEAFDGGQNGLIQVLNGGTLTNGGGYIGYYGNAKYNQVLVDGSGSVWNSGYIDMYNSGTYNSITVSNSGRINFTGGQSIKQSNNNIYANSGGVLSTTTLALGSNSLFFNGGILEARSTATTVSGGGIVLAGMGTFDSNTYTSTVSSPISGSGALTKTGAGTLTLSNASNTYTGGTSVNGGILTLSGTGVFGATTGALTLGGGTLDLAATTNRNVGALSITAATSVSLADTIRNGSITGTSYAASNSSGNAIVSAALLVNGTAGLTMSGIGTLTLSGNNTYTGTSALNAGTVQANHASALGNGGNITFGGGALQFSSLFNNATAAWGARVKNSTSAAITLDTNGQNVTVSGNIDNSNTAGLTKLGGGNLILTGTNTFTGTTTVSTGKLYLNGSNAGTAAISVAGSATLGGSGSASTATAMVASGGIIEAGTGGTGSLGLAGLTFSGSGTINIYNVANYTASPAVNVTATNGLTNSGTPSSVSLALLGTAPTGTGTAHLLQYSGTQLDGAGFGAFALNTSGITLGARAVLALANNPGFVDLNYSLDHPVWSGDSSVWDTGTAVNTGATFNWKSAVLGTSTNFVASDAAVFNDAVGGGSTTVTLSAADVSPGSVTFDNTTAKSYTLQGGFGITGGTSLTKSNTGTLTIANANSYTGGTSITGGALSISADSNIGNASGGLTLGTGGTLHTTASFSTNRAVTLNTGGGVFSQDASGTSLTIAGSIGGLGGLTQSGPGALVLSGSNNYNGGTTLNGGTLTAGNATAFGNGTGAITINGGALDSSAASLVLTGNKAQVWNGDFVFTGSNSLNLGSGAVNLGATGASTTRILTANANTLTVAGVISNGTNGSTTGLTKSGNGTLLLSNANTYSGATTVNAGILQAGSTTAFGPAASASLAFGAGSTGTVQLNGNSMTVIGLNTDATTPGTPILNNGTSAATLTVNNAIDNTFAGSLQNGSSGGLSLIKTGVGKLSLSGSNTYTGATAISGGVLSFGAASNLPTNATNITFNNGGRLEYTGTSAVGNYTFTGGNDNQYITVANAQGNVAATRSAANYNTMIKDGPGTLTVTSNFQDAGGLSVLEGTAILSNTSSRADWYSLCNSLSVSNGATVKLGNTGIGVIYYGAAFTMSGGTYDVNGQIPTADQNHSAGAISGSGTITNNSTTSNGLALFQINGTPTFSGNMTDGASRSLALTITAGTGPWTLSGNNTYSGATTLNSGALQAGSTTAFSPNSAYAVASGKTLNLANYNNSIGSLTGAGNVTLGTATLTVGNDNTSPAAFSGAISGAGGLIKTGTGTATLSGTNTYYGGTIVNAGTVTGTGSAALGASTGPLTVNNPNTGVGTAVVLNLSTTAATTTGTLSGSLATPASGTNTATINNGGQLFTVNQTADASYAGGIAGAGAFTLGSLSTHTLTLTGNNTYLGTTTVAAGTLLVNGSLSGGGAVSVSDTAVLGGTGLISGAVTLNGGTLAPGASIESLATGALTMNNGTTFVYEMNSESHTADLQKVNGGLVLTGLVKLTLGDLDHATPTAFAPGTTFSLFNYIDTAVGWTGGYFQYEGNQLDNNEVFSDGLTHWRITYGATTGGINFADEYNATGDSRFINLTAIPEPGSLLALGCLIGSGVLLRSRKNRRVA